MRTFMMSLTMSLLLVLGGISAMAADGERTGRALVNGAGLGGLATEPGLLLPARMALMLVGLALVWRRRRWV